MNKTHQVTFQPSGRKMRIPAGTPIIEAAGRAGIILRIPCGGTGTCGKCRVRISSGDADPKPSAEVISAEEMKEGWRLACSTPVTSDLVIDIPEDALFENSQKILEDHAQGVVTELAPHIRIEPFTLPLPTYEDTRSDARRLEETLSSPVEIPADILRKIPAFIRKNDWQGNLLIRGDEAIDLLQSIPHLPLLGVAFDLGTTTVVGTLINLNTGREMAVASRMNAQIAEGDDVLTRILKVREEPKNLQKLQQAATDTLNEIIDDLCEQCDIATNRIFDITLAGNTTMQQLACGIDPSALGEVPFIPAFEAPLMLDASQLDLHSNAHARIFVFPQIGCFVGGDTVAAILASGLDSDDKPKLLVDIGTNGEIVLACNGRLMCTSTAAGPAFEGARIKQGMRASSGAIDRIEFNDDLNINVIGDTAPTGLCGTALIDAVAGMLDSKLLESTGRIMDADECTAPEKLKARLSGTENDARFMLADSNGDTDPVCIWQRDIRELQLASGAIRAGIQTLLQLAGINESDLDSILLAGAFGNYIRRENAIRIGLLPSIPLERVQFIGNAASLGAKQALTSRHSRRRAEKLADRAEHIDLSADPNFQMAFGMAMMFPE